MKFSKMFTLFAFVSARRGSRRVLGRHSRDLSYWNRIYNGLNVQIGPLEEVSPVVCQIYLYTRNNQGHRKLLLHMLNQRCNSLKTSTTAYK